MSCYSWEERKPEEVTWAPLKCLNKQSMGYYLIFEDFALCTSTYALCFVTLWSTVGYDECNMLLAILQMNFSITLEGPMPREAAAKPELQTEEK